MTTRHLSSALAGALLFLAGGALPACTNSGPVPAAPNETGMEVGTQVGQLALEIVGEDLDGVEFRLSEYVGKVVVLDFWGDW